MDLESRIDALEKRVAFLEGQLQQSRSIYTDEASAMSSAMNAHTENTPANDMHIENPNAEHAQINIERVFVSRPQQTVRPENSIPSANRNTTPAARPVSPRPVPRQPIVRQQTPKNTDMESFIGKNVFVVVASVLIFVGLVVFAAAVMPYLSDKLKFAAMVIGSIGLSAAGYLLSRKKQSAFNVSLLACGLGAIYITLFTGRIYFKFISDIPLYISLLIWCFIVYYCSRYRSILFNIIGQSGILISLIMGTVSISDSGDSRMALFLAVYVIIAQILYNFLYKQENYLINSVFALLSSVILSFIVHDFISYSSLDFDEGLTQSVSVIVMTAVLFVLIIYILIRNIVYIKTGAISELSYVITGYSIYFSLIIVMYRITSSHNGSAYITAFLGLLMYAVTEYLFFGEDRETATDIFSTVLPCISVFCCLFTEHSFCSALLIPCLIAIYSRFIDKDGGSSRMTLPCTTLCGALISSLYVLKSGSLLSSDNIMSDPANMAYLITGIIFIVFIWIISAPETDLEKISLYLSLLTVMLFQIPFSPDVSLLLSKNSRMFICLCLMLIIQLYTRLRKDFIDKDLPPFSQGTFICYFIVNALCMLYSLYALYSFGDNAVLYAAALALAAGLFSLNVLNLINSDNSGFSPYIGIKYTVLVFAAASKFGNKPVTSILLFILAVACLIFGQKLKQKPLRLYALILALLSTVKLLVFDIAYDNLVIRAFSLIVCGGLCFGISLFYTHLEKSNKNDTP